MNVRKIITDHVPLIPSKDGESYGDIVNNYIATAIEDGEEIQSFEIEFDSDGWEALKADYRGKANRARA